MKLLFSFLRALRVVLMLLLLSLTVLIYVILETPYGLKLVNTFLPLFLPFTLQIDSPRGALLDVLYANKVIYRDDTVEVTVKNPQLRLDALALFSGEIKIDAVEADDVSIIILDNGEPSTLTRDKLLQNLRLPFSLRVNSARLNHLRVEESKDKPWVDLQDANLSALMNGEPHFTLRAQWHTGTINLIPDLPLHSIEGQFSIDGQLPHYRLSFRSQLQYAEEQSKRLAIMGEGDFSGLNLKQVHIQQDKDMLDAPMQITWLPHFQWNIPQFGGRIHNYPVKGHVAMRTDGQHWQIEDSEIKVHDASAQLTGQYQQQAQFSFKLAIPNMSTLISGAKGHLFAQGQWTGNSSNPQIQATVNAANISVKKAINVQGLQGKLVAKSIYPIVAGKYWTQFQLSANAKALQININGQGLEGADLHFEGAVDGVHSATLHSEFRNLHLGGTTIQSVTIDATNKNARQKANILFYWAEKRLSATLSGQYENNAWIGALENLKTNFDIQLQKRNAIFISKNKLRIDSTCFGVAGSHLCGGLSWQKDKIFDAKLQGKNIPIETLSQFLLPKEKISGSFSLDANIAGDGYSIQSADLNLAFSDGELKDNTTSTPLQIPFKASHVKANLSAKGLVAEGDLNLLDQPPIRWQLLAPQLQLNDSNWMSTPINGYLQFSSRQLGLLADLYPQLKNIKGLLSADLTIEGTLGKPRVLGKIEFKEGQLDVPSLGLHLAPIELSAEAQNNRILYGGQVNTNPGLLNLQGYTDLDPTNPKTQFQINGNALTVMNTSEYKVSASPQLLLTWFNQILDVEGQITIPNAKINPIDLGDTVTLSNDVVFVNGKERKEKARLPIRTHVKIILGDKIYLAVKGLTARLAGNVDIKENENNNQTIGIGQINLIDGQFKGHGQKLTVRTGRAIFAGGDVANPGLYVEAVRVISTYVTASGSGSTGGSGQSAPQSLGALQSDVTIGARITGTVDTPVITFFSEPAVLSQSQILSYLVLGKDQSSGSALDTTLLLKAVSFLDIGGNETAATKNTLQKDLGLDEVSIQSQQEYSTESQSLVNNTSLVLGKALSPKLFVDYSIGLIEPINILHIRYQLSKHFTLRSESNVNAQGIDVFYNVER